MLPRSGCCIPLIASTTFSSSFPNGLYSNLFGSSSWLHTGSEAEGLIFLINCDDEEGPELSVVGDGGRFFTATLSFSIDSDDILLAFVSLLDNTCLELS
uniref:Putative secreted protein n=1 Tax=Anopheles darlingi TaxID=43151 RepID=A0A2M4DIV4_ANODA